MYYYNGFEDQFYDEWDCDYDDMLSTSAVPPVVVDPTRIPLPPSPYHVTPAQREAAVRQIRELGVPTFLLPRPSTPTMVRRFP